MDSAYDFHIKHCVYSEIVPSFYIRMVHFLLARSPEGATIKQKMLYTSSKDALRKKLVGIGKERQCCDEDDLNWTNVEEVLIRSEAA